MKRDEMVKKISKFLQGYEDTGFKDEREDDADALLTMLERAGMQPPSIPTGASGWEVGKGAPSYVNQWEKDDETASKT